MKLTYKHLELFRLIHKRKLNDCCSDLSSYEESLLTKDQWNELYVAYSKWNGDYDSSEQVPDHVPDFMVYEYILHCLINNFSFYDNVE